MLRPLLLGSAFLFAAAGAAFAYPTEVSVRSEVVRFSDLNINYAPDADVLLDRIHHAANHVCRGDPGSIASHRVDGQCAEEAQDRAVAEVDNTMLTARYRGVTPEVVIEEDDGYYKK